MPGFTRRTESEERNRYIMTVFQSPQGGIIVAQDHTGSPAHADLAWAGVESWVARD